MMLLDLIVAIIQLLPSSPQFAWIGVWEFGERQPLLIVEKTLGSEDRSLFSATLCDRYDLLETGACLSNTRRAICRIEGESLSCSGIGGFPARARVQSLSENKILYTFQDIYGHGIEEGHRLICYSELCFSEL